MVPGERERGVCACKEAKKKRGKKKRKRKGGNRSPEFVVVVPLQMATPERSHGRDEEEDSRPQSHLQVAQGREVTSVAGIINHARYPNLGSDLQSLIQEMLIQENEVAQAWEAASVFGIRDRALHRSLHPSTRGREIASVVGIPNHALHPNLHPGFMTCPTVTREMNTSSESSKLPLLFIERNHSSEERSLFDISTKKFHIIKNPDFQGAKCICGRGQWLLMCREVDRGDCWFSLFLLNPVSGVKVVLPTVHGVMRGPCTFSLCSGAPDLIICCTSPPQSALFTLRIMRASDVAWEEHSIGGVHNTMIRRVALAGTRVLCVSYRGRVIVFDLLERSLRYFAELNQRLLGFASVVECDGEIMMVDGPIPRYRYFRFQRFDWGLMNWAEVDERELQNASWFMDCPSACMRACEGMKAYTLMPNEHADPNPPAYNEIRFETKGPRIWTGPSGIERMFNIYMHDLGPCPEDPLLATAFMEKKSTESLMPEDVRAMSARWVGGDILC